MRWLFAVLISLVIIVLLASICWSIYRPWQLPAERIKLVRQQAFLRVVARCVVDVYERTGVLLASEQAFVSAALYPFHRSVSDIVGTSVHFEASAGKLAIKTALKEGNPVVVSLPQDQPETVTRRRMEFLLEGKSSIDAFITAQRKLLTRYASHLTDSAATWRELSVPNLTSDLPRSDEELQGYLSWIKSLLGEEILRDGFGREMRVSLRQRTLYIRSAGADGTYNTSDDIVLARTPLNIPAKD